MDRLSIRWKSDLSDKIKRDFFQAAGVNTILRMHHIDADKTYWEKARQELHKNATSYIELILEATPHETATVRSLTSNLQDCHDKTCRTLMQK